MNYFLSIIIPAFNEESRISFTLQKVIEFLNANYTNYEIIVVDDGSKDKTVDVCNQFKHKVNTISLGINSGKGAAVRKGMIEAKGDIRIFMDADLSTPIYEIKKVIDKLQNGSDVCIGSRALNREMVKEHQPFYRELMGKTFNKIVQLFVFKGIEDTQCGFKAFSKKAAAIIFPNSKINGFSFDVELIYLALKAGLKVEQVPVEWYNDKRSTVHPIYDSLNMLFEIMKIRKIHKN